jgi:hypothetical protein
MTVLQDLFKSSPRAGSRKTDFDVICHEEAIEMQDLVMNQVVAGK